MKKRLLIILSALVYHIPVVFGHISFVEPEDSLARHVEVYSMAPFCSSYMRNIDEIDYWEVKKISEKNKLKVGGKEIRLLLRPLHSKINKSVRECKNNKTLIIMSLICINASGYSDTRKRYSEKNSVFLECVQQNSRKSKTSMKQLDFTKCQSHERKKRRNHYMQGNQRDMVCT